MDLRGAIEDAVARLPSGGQLVAVHELTGGTSAHVCSVDITDGSSETRRVVFRQHRSAGFKGHSQRVCAVEFGVLMALSQRGFEVPEPYLLDDSGVTTDPFLIMEWVDGSTDVNAAELPSALEQMADFLARLHALDPRRLAVSELEELEDPLSDLLLYLPQSDVGERVRAALVANEIERVANRPVLVHGDYWPGNVMWNHGRLVAVLDWEDTRIGDPLADLACARVELLCRYGAGAMADFTRHYLTESAKRQQSVNRESLPLWDAYVSASALATMASWGLDPSEEEQRRRSTETFFDRAAQRLCSKTFG